MKEINIGELMTYRAYLSPNMEAFVGNGYRYSYRDVNCRVNQFASFLQESGIKHVFTKDAH